MIRNRLFRIIKKEKIPVMPETLQKQPPEVKSGDIIKPLLLLDPTHRRFFLMCNR